VYCVLAGLERFAVEFVRAKDDRLLGPFTLAQLTSVILVGIGIYLLQAWRDAPDPEPGPYLAGAKAGAPSKP
jgi:prolipoprotein diacylglyceryltransferase